MDMDLSKSSVLLWPDINHRSNYKKNSINVRCILRWENRQGKMLWIKQKKNENNPKRTECIPL